MPEPQIVEYDTATELRSDGLYDVWMAGKYVGAFPKESVDKMTAPWGLEPTEKVCDS